ncbi:hypothetical protein P9281_15140 [Caballeronia sp. LP003]|nr:hypothetical protein [Caballeronia sp. LP003]MDR5787866.1 hypothetical protein [Caballeronia sp. LP003]
MLTLIGAWSAGTVFARDDVRLNTLIESCARLQMQIEAKHRVLPDDIAALIVEDDPFPRP